MEALTIEAAKEKTKGYPVLNNLDSRKKGSLFFTRVGHFLSSDYSGLSMFFNSICYL